MHFAGDHGVGKTYTAELIGEALFSFHKGVEVENRYAFYVENGVYFPNDNSYASRGFYERIARQILKCPRSVILINEIQSTNYNIIAGLQPFFQGSVSYFDKNISTRSAIFILTSDFGHDDLTRDWSIQELAVFVKNHFETFLPSRDIIHALVRHVPFPTLDNDSVSEIIANSLTQRLACSHRNIGFEIDNEVIPFLCGIWWNHFRGLNGRSVMVELIPNWVQPAIQALNIPLLRSPPNDFKRIIRLHIDNNELKATLIHRALIYKSFFTRVKEWFQK